MRTLYLDGGRRALVLRDGPSLRVVAEGRAHGMYPFRLLARVVVCGPVQWDSEALLACLDQGIPVTFLTAEGDPRAYCLAAQARRQPLNDRLEEFLERPDWRTLYENWRRAAERREIMGVLRRLKLRAPDLRPDRVAGLLLEVTAPGLIEAARAVLRYWHGLLAARVASKLSEAGAEAPLLIERRPGWNLPADCTRIAAWEHYIWLREWTAMPREERPEPGRADFRRQLTGIFESRSEETDRRLALLLNRFMYWLGGIR